MHAATASGTAAVMAHHAVSYTLSHSTMCMLQYHVPVTTSTLLFCVIAHCSLVFGTSEELVTCHVSICVMSLKQYSTTH